MPRPEAVIFFKPAYARSVCVCLWVVSFNFLDFVGAENHTMIYTNRDVPIDP